MKKESKLVNYLILVFSIIFSIFLAEFISSIFAANRINESKSIQINRDFFRPIKDFVKIINKLFVKNDRYSHIHLYYHENYFVPNILSKLKIN